MKKIELHLHFDGSIDIDYTNKMLGYDATSELVDTTSKNLTEYLAKFDLPIKLLQDLDNIEMYAYLLGKQLEKDDVIYAMDITERKGAFSLNKMNSITASRTSENHCTGLKRSYKDALSGSNTARMVEYIGFRNSDNALLTLGNMRVETKFPIYKIN